ncbi:hypothetical protein [Streptomyces sp. NPDC014734]|uniref:hypothetical protein n=1 Tax=Streptomyces sp. NPDC014734 TaxID=3364886 RepID=UPI0036FDD5F9
MDQYDSQRPCGRQRNAQDATPIYDRLLAEWRAARGAPEPLSPPRPAPPGTGGRVPAARTSEETGTNEL